MGAPVGVAQRVEETGVALGPVTGVHAEDPAQPLDRLARIGADTPSLLFADFTAGLIPSLDQEEAVDHERRVRTVVLDRLDVGPARATAGPLNGFCLRAGVSPTATPPGSWTPRARRRG
jgi:hypothetical protein